MDVKTIEFSVTRMVHPKPGQAVDGDFRVMQGTVAGERHSFSVRGMLGGEIHKGDLVTAQGVWKQHPKYGAQFEAISASVLPNNKAGFVGWAEVRLPWLGPKRAMAIWDKYKEGTWAVLKAGDTAPLVMFRGITESRAQEIIEAYIKYEAEANQLRPLMDYGFHYITAAKIVRVYGGSATEALAENPYQFMSVGGVEWDQLDRLTRDDGMARDDWRRVNGMAVNILTEEAKATGATRGDGHLLKAPYALTGGNKAVFLDALERGKQVLPAGPGFMGLKVYVEAEQRIARFMGLGGDLGSFHDMQLG
jgi:exodeoxyribonuclease V alpha subunit